MARITFLHRRDGRYYLQVRMPVHDGDTARTRVFRSALGTSAFVVARRRLSLCMAWIVALKDNPELPRRGAFLLAQMRGYLDRGAPVDADALAARGAMEHYVQIWLTECRVFDCNPGEICPGFTETWKEFVAQNVDGETGHRAKAEDDSFRRGFAVGRQTALGDGEARTTAAAVGADQADVGRAARDDFRRRDVNLTPGYEFPIGAIRRSIVAEPDDAMSSPFVVDEFIAPLERKEVAVPPTCSGAGLTAPAARADRVSEAPGRAEVETASNATINVGNLAELDEFLPEPTDPLSVALEKFLGREKKRHGDDRARERVGLVVPFVIAVIGDKPVSSVTRRELGKIDLALPDIPTRTNIPKEHCVSLAARYLYAKKNGWEGLQRLAENTLSNRYHTTLNTFFEWLYQREALHEQPYRFEFVQKDNPEQVDRDVFAPEEAIKLVNLPLFTGCESLSRVWNSGELFVQDARYWGYVLALVTGMRPAEIAQIRCRDLIAIEDEGELVWFVDFTDRMMNVKSKSARRMIPLVPLVIELGLVKRRDLLMEAGHERLFPEWPYMTKKTGEVKYGHYLSKSWQYIKRKFKFSRDGVTLYSARHTFAQRLDEVGKIAERSRHLVMGHSTSGSARLTYGARHLALGIAKLINSIKDPTLERVSEILLDAKRRADRGELKRVDIMEIVSKGGDD